MTKFKKEKFNKEKLILTTCMGQCVHVAGVQNFIEIAKQLGFTCIFLGPARAKEEIIEAIKKYTPEIVGLSYRLTGTTVKPLLKKLLAEMKKLEDRPSKLIFAGTPEVVDIAKQFKEFDHFFVGGEPRYEILSVLKNSHHREESNKEIPSDLISRIEWKKPYPIVRAHFGLPSLEDTLEGIKTIAEAKVIDVISIAPDQNTQENFFHPDAQNKELAGAGGVPLRNVEDFRKLDEARNYGNHPLLRIYAGTRDFIKLAQLYQETIKNAWAAIPIFWFNQMDGRGPLALKESIIQHLKAIKWHGKHSIPVEINDPHHWSLRNAPDAIAVADMYLCGIIAKKLGVKHFVAQYMFNTPPNLSFDMDLAKMLAKNELLMSLQDKSFQIIKQVRAGLASFPLNLNKAKGQLAAATMIQLLLKPDIVHVVSFSEASHAALPEDIIESCNIVDQVVQRMYSSNITVHTEQIEKRKRFLIDQAHWIINLIPYLAKTSHEKQNPWISPSVLERLVSYGIFDAPHLKNNAFAKGEITTELIDGACCSINRVLQKSIDERERITKLMADLNECSGENLDMKLLKKEEVTE
ncbi:MAG: hypothetical protein BAJALOKI1v1_1880005 [Promethearchaeota archaeon]|nr:MAG: hypothetical protein BAJALOKI1v1_1880005 [Candidatus Lokiarchaeota archaeon]